MYHTTKCGQQIFEGTIKTHIAEHRCSREEAIEIILDARAVADEFASEFELYASVGA